MTQEALKLALEVNESMKDVLKQVNELIAENKALKEALAQEQEPVAVVDVHEFYDNCANFSLLQKLPKGKHTLYTTPPQRTEQEPVALQYLQKDIDWQREQQIKAQASTPPQRTWVGLTDEQIAEIENEYIVDYRIPAGSAWNFAKDIEAKLKEKNT